MGWGKKRGEDCSKIELVLAQKEEGKKEPPKKDSILEREGKKGYVLSHMIVTFPTCQAERSPLKLPASRNTAPQQHRKIQG